ncbi:MULTISPECIES: head-tail connector protein [Pseudomonas]|uniref:head-tail connector protein n=1 Tax=Pseudomonas TaxID=286 RepID=UPI0025995E9F|nr:MULTISPECIES: head-tail connector protein [Pseudomonas]
MIDLALVKQHLRVEHSEEDTLIQGYIDAATAFIEKHCDRVLVETPLLPEEMGYTKDVIQAAMLLVGHWYANREAVVVGQAASNVPMAVESLLWYRKRF